MMSTIRLVNTFALSIFLSATCNTLFTVPLPTMETVTFKTSAVLRMEVLLSSVFGNLRILTTAVEYLS